RHKALKEAREEVADEPRSGRPTTTQTEEIVDRVREVLRTNCKLSLFHIQHHVTKFLRGIPVEELQGAFQAWQTRLRKCIDAGGMYFEEY
ncbi:hypothetical protein HAZT_HAZT008783, partial [Hyalella azteca]